jgi:single-strand DNA-binding protein
MKNLHNTVNLIGNLGMDPEVKKLESGKLMARFSLGVKEMHLNEANEHVTDVQWHSIVAWGKTAEICEKYLKKGSKVALEGRLSNREYENTSGEKRYMTEVVVNELMMLDPKKR